MSLVAYYSDSDEENGDADVEESSTATGVAEKVNSLSLPLPKVVRDKSSDDDEDDEEEEANEEPVGFVLPPPKPQKNLSVMCEEEDDEFLHKKAIPLVASVERPPLPVTPLSARGKTVKITIPSMSEYNDVETSNGMRVKNKPLMGPASKPLGLLSLLPKPKAGAVFIPQIKKGSASHSTLVPDSVTNRKKQSQPQPPSLKKQAAVKSKAESAHKLIANYNNSDGSDSDNGTDFFSLNAEDTVLPEVSENEVKAMVAEKAAKMVATTKKFADMVSPPALVDDNPNTASDDAQLNSSGLDTNAIQALIGNQAKRGRFEQINVVDLSSDQVLPSKDEWMRTALASSTEFQPRGSLNTGEMAPGSKRKHQITYLAHQAKTNEQELQAMWAANRQTRRQTQSKYGF